MYKLVFLFLVFLFLSFFSVFLSLSPSLSFYLCLFISSKRRVFFIVFSFPGLSSFSFIAPVPVEKLGLRSSIFLFFLNRYRTLSFFLSFSISLFLYFFLLYVFASFTISFFSVSLHLSFPFLFCFISTFFIYFSFSQMENLSLLQKFLSSHSSLFSYFNFFYYFVLLPIPVVVFRFFWYLVSLETNAFSCIGFFSYSRAFWKNILRNIQWRKSERMIHSQFTARQLRMWIKTTSPEGKGRI